MHPFGGRMRLRRFVFGLVLGAAAMAANAGNGIKLSGTVEYRTDTLSLEIAGDVVCFIPSAESAKLLPRRPDDARAPWFCFENVARSKKLLGIAASPGSKACGLAGAATVRVSDYIVYAAEGDGHDVATLRSVVRRPRFQAIACD